MLKIERLDKKFNKGKKNEIHVINNTTLEMKSPGLVALLGPSGCGKTTLLNVIGGLDGAGSGDVYINGKKITRRISGKVDSIRSLNIGYIFQNYNLVDNLTVYENVAIALRMTGLKNEHEIEEKVNYVLQKSGMYRYRSRMAGMLSGGERQRVGIARAIVKNPPIIIADEPTGNLDSRNTIEIMNIIKTISKNRLVILVTHEEQLAQFYATRIIRLADGKVVSDEANDGEKGLYYRLDHKIYLKDINDHKRINTDTLSVDFYNDSESRIMLDIVIRDGSILIRNKDPESRIEVVDDDSAIELIDDHYRCIEKGDEDESEFDISKLDTRAKRRYRSVIGPVKMIKDGFRTMFNYGIIKKILLAGFVISAIFVTYSICSIAGTLNVTDDKFVTVDKSYLSVVSKRTDTSEYDKIEKSETVNYAMPGTSRVSLPVNYTSYFQTSMAEILINGSLSDINKLNETNLIYGRMPEKDKEIVVDKMAIKEAIDGYQTKEVGLGSVRSYLDKNVKVENLGEYKIVGISDCESPCIYTDSSLFVNFIANLCKDDDYTGGLYDYTVMKNKVSKVKGDWPSGDYQVMVNENLKDDLKIGKTVNSRINGKKLEVSGYFKDKKDREMMLVSPKMLKYRLLRRMPGFTVCPNDKSAALDELREGGFNAKDSYESSREQYIKQHRAYSRASLLVAAVILAISCTEIFIIMRASFMSRVGEVGVYRAIGVRKRDIYRMFMGEILAITTIASLPGFLAAYYVIAKLAKTNYFGSIFMTGKVSVAACIIVIYLTNIIFGLMPVFRTIRRKPAEILSRTDVN